MLTATAKAVGQVVGLAGVGVVAVGVGVGSTRAVGYGSTGAFIAAMLAGVSGATAPVVIAATLGALLSWDLGEHALTLGVQVGRDVPTWRGELGHAGASLAVGLAAGVGVIVVYRVATGGLAPTALVVLSIAAVLLTAALRH
jgi:hypothetical protein